VRVKRERVVYWKETHFDKVYRAEVACAAPVEPARIAAAATFAGDIVQRTPQRVAHRRADLDRHARSCACSDLVDRDPASGNTSLELRVLCQHGTYVKEWISGDEGRTTPSLSSLLGAVPCAVLDVEEILTDDVPGPRLPPPGPRCLRWAAAGAAAPAAVRLRCSRSDFVRSLVERQPAWAHATPAAGAPDGDRGVTCYRLAAGVVLPAGALAMASATVGRTAVSTVVPGAVVALRLVLDEVAPADHRLLDLPPSRAFARGESGPRGGRARRRAVDPRGAAAAASAWPEEKVGELLALLRARQRLGATCCGLPGVTMGRHHGASCAAAVERMGGFVLDPALLEDLVGLSLQLDLELLAD
jgi:hypothetical protein